MKQSEVVQSQLDQQAARMKFLRENAIARLKELRAEAESVISSIERCQQTDSGSLYPVAVKAELLLCQIREIEEQRYQLAFKKDHAE